MNRIAAIKYKMTFYIAHLGAEPRNICSIRQSIEIQRVGDPQYGFCGKGFVLYCGSPTLDDKSCNPFLQMFRVADPVCFGSQGFIQKAV